MRSGEEGPGLGNAISSFPMSSAHLPTPQPLALPVSSLNHFPDTGASPWEAKIQTCPQGVRWFAQWQPFGHCWAPNLAMCWIVS